MGYITLVAATADDRDSIDMKNRLEHLQVVLNQPGGGGASAAEGLDDLPEGQAAPDGDDGDLSGVLQQAQRVRLEIGQIRRDVGELRDTNRRGLSDPSRPADATSRDANAICADIKRRGAAVLRELRALSALSEELQTQRGSEDPVVRIAQAQRESLGDGFREAVADYNDAEAGHRVACKTLILRQLEVAGRDVTEEDLEAMLESGEWKVFGLQAEGKTASSALAQIEGRHRELLDLEERVRGVQELLLDMAVLTKEQGGNVTRVEINVQKAEMSVQDGLDKLGDATKHDKDNPCKKLFCCCFAWCKN